MFKFTLNKNISEKDIALYQDRVTKINNDINNKTKTNGNVNNNETKIKKDSNCKQLEKRR